MKPPTPRSRRPARVPRSDGAYEAQSRGFVVRVRPSYLPDQSDPHEHRYVWAYRIEIENRSPATAQLVSRHWEITDASGRLEEVDGPGVVGEQPTIRPGETFSYASGCPLSTPSGLMVGRYRMLGDDGQDFEIEVPAFSLDLPAARRVMN